MMVTFISQCEKNALKKTRRVLDAFADRIGDNTWQTVITEDGLITVKKMLRQTASKSTAVSCHWIRSRSRSQFLWVVGNRNKFDEQGVVPVNFTENKTEQYMDSGQWKTLEVIKYAAAISGLFHDFGKANVLFQQKLDSEKKKKKNKKKENQSKSYEPYRHEWVSLRLFQAFVGDKNDEQWLEALGQIEKDQNTVFFRDGIDGGVVDNHPLGSLPPLAKLIAWLILTHHRLPLTPSWKDGVDAEPLNHVEHWFERGFDAIWNSYNCNDADINDLVGMNWTFTDDGLPYQSMKWRSNASIIASKAKSSLTQLDYSNYLDDNIFTSHLARLCLMLADHHFSDDKRELKEEWRNPNYAVYANTNRQTKALKQQLDEHLIGVAYHAKDIVKALPRLNASLMSLPDNAFLEGSTPKNLKKKFGWQDDAKKLALKLSEASAHQGFFGINMASTGKGKTLANAKIMYALGDKTGKRRFSVALGLRALTLQTGREYRSELELNDEQLAIAVGGTAVKQLFENSQERPTTENLESETGSESQNEYLDPDLYVDYEGANYEHSLSKWTKDNPRIEKLIQAPVLVCTIDHLVPATEGTRGGKQIAPMLRLLTSNLVIDEPDDFGLDDLPALCRLVHWAGLLGSRVLLSTATMPPALAYALFDAYQVGWKQYAIANILNWNNEIVCAWFDEFGCLSEKCDEWKLFIEKHNSFSAQRVKNIAKNILPKRKGYIANIENTTETGPISSLAKTIHSNILALHQNHHLSKEGKNISIGLVRMANINPLVAVAEKLLQMDSPDDTLIHYCVYHSRYPLAMRSHLESKLDKLLKRHDPEAIWHQEDISKVLSQFAQSNHIFVVLASPVAEVGRDHDYDWAVVEPSSMRSIIQLAGRILRHRNIIPETPNVCLLNQNYRALCKKPVCFEKPGFESSKLQFKTSHKLEDLILREQYESITSIPKIVLSDDKECMTLIGLEQKSIATQLFGDRNGSAEPIGGAKVWWRNHPHWSGEVQSQQRFRKSKKDEAYYLFLRDEYSNGKWQWKNEAVYPARFCEPTIEIRDIDLVDINRGCRFWFNLDAKSVYTSLASDFGIDLSEVSRRFGEIRLVQYDEGYGQGYCYHPHLGVYQEV